MKIIIPSYKRPKSCMTAKYLKDAYILANESEAEEYRANNANRVIAMPDKFGGNMARVRNFILSAADGEDVVMLDDDIKYIGYFEKMQRRALFEEEVYPFFEDNFRLAREFGTPVWGLNLLEDKMAYREYSPFSLSAVILGPCMGIGKECSIRFDERLGLKEDYDFSLQALMKYRKIMRWNKFFYLAGHIDMTGGCGSYRTSVREAEQIQAFQRKWGKKVVQIKDNDINPVVKVPIRGI